MRRQVNWVRYFGILILTIIIFFLGTFIGSSVEEAQVANMYTQLQEQDLSYQNVVTERTYIRHLLDQGVAENRSVSCEALVGAYETSISSLEDSRLKLESYLDTASSQQEAFYRLRNHYANLQIEYWMLAQEVNRLCPKSFDTVLYFFSEDDEECPACQDQGVHLSYVKQKLKDKVMIFSFSVDSQGAATLLKQRYDVSQRNLPVVVINEEINGFLTNEEVFTKLCSKGLNHSVCSS